MPDHALSQWIVACLLLGLRIGPVFAFAPPFSLIRVPARFRVLFGFALSVGLVGALPNLPPLPDPSIGGLAVAAMRELMLGGLFALVLNLTFAALYMVGRAIDIQSGYGLALLIDPASRSQVPLVGTLFAFAAGAVFFSVDGHLALLRLLAASLNAVPLGTWHVPDLIERLPAFMSMSLVMGVGIGAAAMLALFLTDAVIAMMSRTVPQMNVLVLGLQVKSIVLLLVLPVCFGIAGALMVRMIAAALDAIPPMI